MKNYAGVCYAGHGSWPAVWFAWFGWIFLSSAGCNLLEQSYKGAWFVLLQRGIRLSTGWTLGWVAEFFCYAGEIDVCCHAFYIAWNLFRNKFGNFGFRL